MTDKPRTLLDKIWDAHCAGTREDGRDIIYMDRNVVDDVRAPHAFVARLPRDWPRVEEALR